MEDTILDTLGNLRDLKSDMMDKGGVLILLYLNIDSKSLSF